MAFEFTDRVREAAFDRQQRRCAFCGGAIAKGRFQGHHVIPKQLGNPKIKKHATLATVDNCVALCVGQKRNCHANVHEGQKYKNGTVPFPNEYFWSHGGNAALHQAWYEKLTILYDEIFDQIQQDNKAAKGQGIGPPAGPQPIPYPNLG
jgi:hypothetical protein